MILCRNLENNKLQGVLPESLNKQTLEVRFDYSYFTLCCLVQDVTHLYTIFLPFRTSGNLCLSFSHSTCNGLSDRPSIQTPQFTVVNMKKTSGPNHKTIIIGAVGGICCALLLIAVAMVIYRRQKQRNDVTFQTCMHNPIRSR